MNKDFWTGFEKRASENMPRGADNPNIGAGEAEGLASISDGYDTFSELKKKHGRNLFKGADNTKG